MAAKEKAPLQDLGPRVSSGSRIDKLLQTIVDDVFDVASVAACLQSLRERASGPDSAGVAEALQYKEYLTVLKSVLENHMDSSSISCDAIRVILAVSASDGGAEAFAKLRGFETVLQAILRYSDYQPLVEAALPLLARLAHSEHSDGAISALREDELIQLAISWQRYLGNTEVVTSACDLVTIFSQRDEENQNILTGPRAAVQQLLLSGLASHSTCPAAFAAACAACRVFSTDYSLSLLFSNHVLDTLLQILAERNNDVECVPHCLQGLTSFADSDAFHFSLNKEKVGTLALQALKSHPQPAVREAAFPFLSKLTRGNKQAQLELLKNGGAPAALGALQSLQDTEAFRGCCRLLLHLRQSGQVTVSRFQEHILTLVEQMDQYKDAADDVSTKLQELQATYEQLQMQTSVKAAESSPTMQQYSFPVANATDDAPSPLSPQLQSLVKGVSFARMRLQSTAGMERRSSRARIDPEVMEKDEQLNWLTKRLKEETDAKADLQLRLEQANVEISRLKSFHEIERVASDGASSPSHSMHGDSPPFQPLQLPSQPSQSKGRRVLIVEEGCRPSSPGVIPEKLCPDLPFHQIQAQVDELRAMAVERLQTTEKRLADEEREANLLKMQLLAERYHALIFEEGEARVVTALEQAEAALALYHAHNCLKAGFLETRYMAEREISGQQQARLQREVDDLRQKCQATRKLLEGATLEAQQAADAQLLLQHAQGAIANLESQHRDLQCETAKLREASRNHELVLEKSALEAKKYQLESEFANRARLHTEQLLADAKHQFNVARQALEENKQSSSSQESHALVLLSEALHVRESSARKEQDLLVTEISKIREENLRLTSDLHSSRCSRDDAEQRVLQLQRALQTLQEQAVVNEQQILNAKAEALGEREKSDRANADLSVLQSELEQCKTTNLNSQNRIFELQTLLAGSEVTLHLTAFQRSEELSRAALVESEHSDFWDLLASFRAQHSYAHVAGFAHKLTTAEAARTDATAQLALLAGLCETHEARAIELQREVDSLQHHLEEAKESSRNTDSALVALQTRKEELTLACARLSTENNERSRLVQELRDSLQVEQTRSAALAHLISRQESDISELRTQTDNSLKHFVSQAAALEQRADQEKRELLNQLERTTDTLNSTSRRVVELENISRTIDILLPAFESRYKELLSSFEITRSSTILVYLELLARAASESVHLATKLRIKDTEADSLRQQLALATSQAKQQRNWLLKVVEQEEASRRSLYDQTEREASILAEMAKDLRLVVTKEEHSSYLSCHVETLEQQLSELNKEMEYKDNRLIRLETSAKSVNAQYSAALAELSTSQLVVETLQHQLFQAQQKLSRSLPLARADQTQNPLFNKRLFSRSECYRFQMNFSRQSPPVTVPLRGSLNSLILRDLMQQFWSRFDKRFSDAEDRSRHVLSLLLNDGTEIDPEANSEDPLDCWFSPDVDSHVVRVSWDDTDVNSAVSSARTPVTSVRGVREALHHRHSFGEVPEDSSPPEIVTPADLPSGLSLDDVSILPLAPEPQQKSIKRKTAAPEIEEPTYDWGPLLRPIQVGSPRDSSPVQLEFLERRTRANILRFESQCWADLVTKEKNHHQPIVQRERKLRLQEQQQRLASLVTLAPMGSFAPRLSGNVGKSTVAMQLSLS
eukprot:TRINITY_DN5500_c0_g1_i1.p1 TRINITY_DN5500_c0_g1~~TRINITY_DN5500_c0_g1_i1.p1  ORF type:complete len:1650 (-),score=300.24 TRINITY_DN5500_c0_g1_i1:8-4957(-)